MSIYGIPIVTSSLVPPGEVWTVARPGEGELLPRIVRLVGLKDDEPEVYPPCRCGRAVRKLNPASDTPKCVGCGYPEELCRCQIQPSSTP